MSRIKPRRIYYYNDSEEKSNKKRVKYLLFLLLITGLLLSTSTYAWFTTNRIATVEMIDVKVRTEGSLEISADAINWKPGITEQEIKNAHTTYPTSVNQLPSYIEPTSTIGTLSNNGFMDMYLGVIKSNSNGDYIIKSTKSVETEGNGDNSDGKFIVFDVFLKISDSKQIYLTDESEVIYNGTSTGTENAIRLAFIIEGNTPSTSSTAIMQSLSTTNNDNVYIWEPNYNTHTTTGIANARSVYGLTIEENNPTRINYDGLKAEFNETENVTLGTANITRFPNYFGTVTPKIQTIKGNQTYQPLWTLNAGVTKVRVYMWLEGQDVDCENNASVGDLSFKFQFSTNPSKNVQN